MDSAKKSIVGEVIKRKLSNQKRFNVLGCIVCECCQGTGWVTQEQKIISVDFFRCPYCGRTELKFVRFV